MMIDSYLLPRGKRKRYLLWFEIF